MGDQRKFVFHMKRSAATIVAISNRAGEVNWEFDELLRRQTDHNAILFRLENEHAIFDASFEEKIDRSHFAQIQEAPLVGI